MGGTVGLPAPPNGEIHSYLALRLIPKLGIFTDDSQMWSTRNVETWDWELFQTSDRKVSVFWNTNSQPVFRFDMCDFFGKNELRAK